MMDDFTVAMEFSENKTSVIGRNFLATYDSDYDRSKGQVIRVTQSTIASVGIVSNLTITVVFLNHKKLRRKIPIFFIINQVRT